MKFVLSFSGGKDSILALHEMVCQGHQPVALLVMYREEAGRSWTHGIDRPLLDAIAQALDLPLLCCSSTGETYARDMERALTQAKEMGAEACAFGDIDLAEHRAWDEARCKAVGLGAELPLWGCDRAENVRRAVALGYECLVKCVRNDLLPESMLGCSLSETLLAEMETRGVDLCGEAGEYHTVVVDGPLFRRRVETTNRGIVRIDTLSAADLVVREERI